MLLRSTPWRANTHVAKNIKTLIISKFFVIVGILNIMRLIFVYLDKPRQKYEKYLSLGTLSHVYQLFFIKFLTFFMFLFGE